MHHSPNHEEIVIAVDCGTGSVRVAAIDFHGVLHSLHSKKLYYQKSVWDRNAQSFAESGENTIPGALEYSPEQLWQLIKELLVAVIEEIPNKDLLVGISVSSQRNGSVFYNERFDELCLYPNIDKRVTPDIINSLPITGPEYYNITGRFPNIFFPAVRLAWMKQYMPNLYSQISSVSMIHDWIAFKISGELKSEPTNAVESLFYDVAAGTWSDTLKQKFNLQNFTLPELIPSGSVVGKVKDGLLSEIGLTQAVDVYLAPADTQCALLGSGVVDPGAVGVVNGSTTPVLMITDEPVFDDKFRTWTDPYWENLYALESNCTASGIFYLEYVRNLNKFLNILGFSKEFHEAEIEKLLVDGQPNTSTLLFPGTRICDFSQSTGAKNIILHDFQNFNLFTDFFRAGVETLAFASVANIRQLEEISKKQVTSITLTGGGAKSTYYCTLVSKLSPQIKVFHTKEIETTSIGAAVAAFADRYGKRTDMGSIFREMGKKPEEVEEMSLSESDESLDKRYEAWVDAYQKFHIL